jgi:DNA repair exonuclease SbcCD ATPase subunit
MLIPSDESLMRDGLTLCADCHAQAPATVSDSGLLENPAALISEYIALHAEEKRLRTRMDELKETLKQIAAMQQRVSNAVTLRAAEQAVKCSFRSTLKCDQELVETLAQRLAEREFDELFERKVSYSPHKERVREFLSRADDEQSEARELLRSAITEIETATLTVIANRQE